MKRANHIARDGMRRPDQWKWMNEAAEAKGDPNVWFEFGERPSERSADNFAQAIKDGRKRAFSPAGQFDACVRGKTVFVMFIGGD